MKARSPIMLGLMILLCVQQAKAMKMEETKSNIPLSDLIEEIKDKTLEIAFSTQDEIQKKLIDLGVQEGKDYNLDSEIFKSTFKSIISDIWVALILSAQIKDLNKESFYAREIEEFKTTLINSVQNIIRENSQQFAEFIKDVLTIRKKLEEKESINLDTDREYLNEIKKLFNDRIILILKITKKLLIEKFNFDDKSANQLIFTRIKPGIGESVQELSDYITKLFLDYYTLLWKYDLPLRDAILEHPERLNGRNLFDGSIDSILHVFESYIQYIYLPRVSFPYKKTISKKEKKKAAAILKERARIGIYGEVEIPQTLPIEEIREKISEFLLKKAQEIEANKAKRLQEIVTLPFPQKDAIAKGLNTFLQHRPPQPSTPLQQNLRQLRDNLTQLKNKMTLLQQKLELLNDKLKSVAH